MTILGIFLLLILSASSALAQTAPPGGTSIQVGTPLPAGVPITVRWTASSLAGVTYGLDGGYNDGNAAFTGTAPAGATSFTRVMPYHAGGSPMWSCVWAIPVGGTPLSSRSCNVAQIPAASVTPIPMMNITVEYDEPTTNDCSGQPPACLNCVPPVPACVTALTDLAKTTVYYTIGTNPTMIKAADVHIGLTPTAHAPDVPAVTVTGGQHKVVTFQVPVSPEDVNVWVTATDTGGLESKASPIVTRRRTPPAVGTVTVNRTTQ